MEFNQIKPNGTWGQESEKVNQNFQKTAQELEKIKGASGAIRWFTTVAEAVEAITNPRAGDFIWVGSPYPGTVHKYDKATRTWVDTRQVPIVADGDMSGYVTQEEFEDLDAEVKEKASQRAFEELEQTVEGKADFSELRETAEQILGQMPTKTSELENDSEFITRDDLGDVGSGTGNMYNVTKLHPLQAGNYYSLQTAIAAVTEDKRILGLVITFAISDSEWKSYQYTGTNVELAAWTTLDLWTEFGAGAGGGTVKGISVNGGDVIEPDPSGIINLPIDEIEVDETLDPDSTNPVENKTLYGRFMELEAGGVFDSDVVIDDETGEATVYLFNKYGTIITQFTVPATGGTGGEVAGARMVLSASVDKPVIKEGEPVQLTYFYDQQYSAGDDAGTSTGQKATIAITIQRGSTVVYSGTVQDVSTGTYTMDISKYLSLGTIDIYVKAAATDPTTGKILTRQGYNSIRVLNVGLSSSYNLASHITGYLAAETATIPFTVSGTGTKIVTLYVDGNQYESRTVTRSGATNGSFSLPMASLTSGRHTAQMVAELEDSSGLVIKSESIYIDLLRRGTSDVIRFIGSMIVFPDGRIFPPSQHLTPVLDVEQYEAMSFDFVVYDSTSNPATMDIYRDGIKSQTISAARTLQTYSNRFTEEDSVSMKFVSGTTEYPFFIQVSASDIDIEEVTTGMVLRLSAAGRSNAEENRDKWENEGVTTRFNGFDWVSNGWTGDVLRLTGGASIDIDFKPFATDPTALGGTYEIEFRCSNVSDRSGIMVDCMDNNVGFQMTTQQAVMKSYGGASVDSLFASDMDVKIVFVVQNKNNHRMMELFVNGVRSDIDQYGSDDSLLQATPKGITISSDYCDVDIRSIKAYNRALSDDEAVDNYIVDRTTGEEMLILYKRNEVLNDDGSDIDFDILRAMGKTVCVIKERNPGDWDLLHATNNKKFGIVVDFYLYSRHGKEYDLVIERMLYYIQGTSSTLYPIKNGRPYYGKGPKEGIETIMWVNGVLVPDLKYAFKPNARPVPIHCIKVDYSDSSSVRNTGGAKIINEVFKECGWLTPPQAAYNGPYDVRTAIDGDPGDLFIGNKYYAKINFNNDKSDSHVVFGFEGIEGFNDEETLAANGEENKCICLEFLNNSHPIGLFQTDDLTEFDDALEERYPGKYEWSDMPDNKKATIQRLWSWLRSCTNEPGKFRREIDDYFAVMNLCGWYVYTDYHMLVDQRVKNMMLATWDGLSWYFLYYDGDSGVDGGRNDGKSPYGYEIDENTWDAEVMAYAFAGHDSLLWKLVREELPDKLREAAETMRKVMTTERVLKVFNEEMMGNWCERVYNKDGYNKYISPYINGIPNSAGGFDYPNYLYSLQGSRYAARTFIIRNRYALLDAKYTAGTYRSDAITAYFANKFSSDPRDIRIKASEVHYFGYGYTNGEPTVSGVKAEAGEDIELTLRGDLIMNDPQNIYGASRIGELDLTDVADTLVQTINLNRCTALKKLDISPPLGNTALNNILVAGCRGLREFDMTGMRSPGFTSIDISNNSRLEKFYAGNTSLTGISFALGAPLTEAVLPTSLTSLEMRALSKLTLSGLTFESAGNITRLVAANCDLLDWQELLTICYGVRYLRVTGINLTGDATMLERFMSIGGIDENGSNTTTCRLVGDYQLTTYVEDDKLSEYRNHYPELNIRQAEYTAIEFDDSVADPANISNLDNKTGYKYGKDYVVSGHIKKILSMRHRVLGKKTAEGVVSVCQLHDENSNYYADSQYIDSATPAVLTGSEGNVWVYEPRYWYKGVNDILNQKKYAYFSTNETVSAPEGKKIEAREINFVTGYVLRATDAYSTLQEALAVMPTMAYGLVGVQGYKRVRFQGVAGALYGAVFLDANDNIVGRILTTSDFGMTNGMYVISDIPTRAVRLGFSIVLTDDRDFVWMTNSEEIADMEPDWVEHKECLGGAYNAIIEDDIARTKSGIYPTASVSMSVIRACTAALGKGFKPFDYAIRRSVVNLALAKYGTRDNLFGSTITHNLYTGRNDGIGMKDTRSLISEGTTFPYDNTLGYESFLSSRGVEHKDIELNGVSGNKYTVTELDGSVRNISRPVFVQGTQWIKSVYFGRFMDILPISTGGSSTTMYTDSVSWNSHGLPSTGIWGTAHSNSGSGQSGLFHMPCVLYNSHVWLSTRLVFRGAIVPIESVTEYKQLQKLD